MSRTKEYYWEEICAMQDDAAYKISSDGAAAVTMNDKWILIDEHTPRGVKLQMISKLDGVAIYGKYMPYDKHFTHWYPLPTFDKEK